MINRSIKRCLFRQKRREDRIIFWLSSPTLDLQKIYFKFLQQIFERGSHAILDEIPPPKARKADLRESANSPKVGDDRLCVVSNKINY